MVNAVTLKVCGLCSRPDIEQAVSCGADYLGFIQYPKSPRYLPLAEFKAMAADLPKEVKKVGVVVYSSMDELETYKDSGFDFIQLHFDNDTPFFEVALWTEILPPQMLWLAPRVPPGRELDLAFLPLADYFLVDSFDQSSLGGTGKTGDWTNFKRLQALYQKIRWVLAGGLSPDNIGEALRTSHAKFVDVNSGVESAPGVKDHAKLKAFVEALAAAQA